MLTCSNIEDLGPATSLYWGPRYFLVERERSRVVRSTETSDWSPPPPPCVNVVIMSSWGLTQSSCGEAGSRREDLPRDRDPISQVLLGSGSTGVG